MYSNRELYNSFRIEDLNRKIYNVILFGLFFMLLSSALKVDKVALLAFIVLMFVAKLKEPILYSTKLYIVLFLTSYLLLISIVNEVFNPMIFFPLFGIIFLNFFDHPRFVEILYSVLSIYILIALFAGVASYILGPNIFVTSLGDKGLPFLRPLMGLSPTVQTFGSICILWMVLKVHLKGLKSNLMFFIVAFAILLTFNRSTYLFFLLFMSLYYRWAFLAFLAFALTIYIAFFDIINLFIFNSSTLSSRSELLQGFFISYWENNTFVGYLFGKATNIYSSEVLRMVKWSHRHDIENIYAMLLHTYGFIGLFLYMTSGVVLVVSFLLKQRFNIAIIFSFYFFFTQFFTQEIVSPIFFLVCGTLMLISTSENASSSN